MHLQSTNRKYSLSFKRSNWGLFYYAKHSYSNYVHYLFLGLSLVLQWDYHCFECKDLDDSKCQECCSHDWDDYCCLNCDADKVEHYAGCADYYA